MACNFFLVASSKMPVRNLGPPANVIPPMGIVEAHMTAVRRLSLLALCLAVLTSCVGIDIAAQSEQARGSFERTLTVSGPVELSVPYRLRGYTDSHGRGQSNPGARPHPRERVAAHIRSARPSGSAASKPSHRSFRTATRSASARPTATSSTTTSASATSSSCRRTRN
jgi:hypothetical protein